VLRLAIEDQFDSIDNFKKEFEETGAKLFGAGWVWLSKDNTGKLFITQGPNAGNPLTENLTPILCFDVWEHAYYLDYQNRRVEYLHKLWDIVDWDIVEARYL
ncbi:MAG: Fe-Mn family superoxide dismutase, partial [Muribaculaceae bacterium]